MRPQLTSFAPPAGVLASKGHVGARSLPMAARREA
jgi:hypothetical protein